MSTIWFYIILLDYKYIFIYRVFRLSAETQLVFLQWIIYYNYVFGLIIYYNIFWNRIIANGKTWDLSIDSNWFSWFLLNYSSALILIKIMYFCQIINGFNGLAYIGLICRCGLLQLYFSWKFITLKSTISTYKNNIPK